MKQIYFLFFALLFCVGLSAQVSFSDDFETYTAGQFLGKQSPKWTTWSGADGGADDIKVSNAKASSGKNSVYFSSTAASGGPADCVLPFEDAFAKDLFEFNMKMFVDEGKTGYFNFQGEKVVGKTWALDINFTIDKKITIASGGKNVLTADYPQNEWFTFTVKGNLSTNRMSALVNAKELGNFKIGSAVVALASIDIYPANADASYYVDDVSYKTEVYVPKPNDLAVAGADIYTRDLTGNKTPVAIIVTNEGSNVVKDVEVSYTIGGVTKSKTVTGLNLASFKSATIAFDELIDVKDGVNNITFDANLLNAGDEDFTNNSFAGTLTGVTPAADKMVVAEEATGTWCQWCPRGAVMMDRMGKRFPEHFAGIAVHNGDPMVVAAYDTGIKALPGFTGFPSATVNRVSIIDPTDIENQFFTRIKEATKTKIKVGASFDEATRTLKISPEVTFKANVTNFKVMVAIVEDSIRKNATGYAQSNAYAGGGAGVMGGFELLPSPVPASKMTYNHVARAMLGEFKGDAFPVASYKKDDKVIVNYEFVLPAELNTKNVKIIPIVFATSGLVDNAKEVSIKEAVANGFQTGTADEVTYSKEVSIYPNPVAFTSIIELDLENPTEVSVNIFDATGRNVGSKNYGKLQGKQQLELNASLLNNGIYLTKINVGNETITKSISVQH